MCPPILSIQGLFSSRIIDRKTYVNKKDIHDHSTLSDARFRAKISGLATFVKSEVFVSCHLIKLSFSTKMQKRSIINSCL